ncbi:MAG: protein kinase [Kofleriaceae bacterium]|nr:protein kinase [Kofleriaceae bacterium]
MYERLGVGGMATVHRAREHGIEGFERIVALKRLLPHLAEDASFVRSFVREAKLASLLRHAHIVQLYELGRVGTTYFISMEYIDGRDVRRILRQARKVTGPPTINVTIALLIQLCDALDYAHTRCDEETGEPLHIVHRDVSPSNLLVTRSGHLKIIDFGIAKAQSQQLRTATGRVKGKLAYMAPEAIAGRELDARSDVFSAGVIAHELLTARPLFASKNEYQTLLKVQKGEILPPSSFNQACPPELDAIVFRALTREPDQRWSSAAEMRDALHEVRIRYHLSATNREITSWCDWAFSMEAPGNNFSGPVNTDSLAGMSQSRSPVSMPLAPPEDSQQISLGAPIAPLGAPVAPLHRDEDEAADVAWGGAQEADSGAPVVLDEVPDHSGRARAPSMAGALAAAADTGMVEHRRTLVSAVAPPPTTTPTRSRSATQPARFPDGSSNDALSGRARRRSSSPPGVGATEAPRDTEPTPMVEASSFGASIVAQRKHGARNAAIGVLVVGAIGGGLYLTLGASSGASAKKAASTAQAVAPAPTPAKLKFIVEPEDATVHLAGIPPHTGSGWSVEVEPGVFQVEISKDGFKTWVTQIELSDGENQTVRVVLEAGGNAALATLVVDSTPQNMTVLVDGHEVGKTPYTDEIPPGNHWVALRESGVIMWRESFAASANTKYEFRPSMSEVKQRERAERERIDRERAADRTARVTVPPSPGSGAASAGAADKAEPVRSVTGGVAGGATASRCGRRRRCPCRWRPPTRRPRPRAGRPSPRP